MHASATALAVRPPSTLKSVLGIVVVTAALSAAIPAGAHTTNRGKATFNVEESGQVRVRIDLELRDLQELLTLELTPDQFWKPSGDEVRAQAFERLRAKSAGWLRIGGDGHPCPVQFQALDPLGDRGANLKFTAQCAAVPKTLAIDWGLAKMTGFDLVAITLVTGPQGKRQTSVLSAKAPRLEVVLEVPSLGATLGRFVVEGVEHIVIGWDHLLFLLALVLGCGRIKRVLLVVSGFTVAHSITLGLGVANVVHVNEMVVESTIALSIAFAAAYHLWALRQGALEFPGRVAVQSGEVSGNTEALNALALAGLFGLVHGLGFATMLRAQLGASDSLAIPLLGFNVGVELGQLVAVGLAFPILVMVGRMRWGKSAFAVVLGGLVCAGIGVGVARILG